jgi:preprotein translocase subunit SecE
MAKVGVAEFVRQVIQEASKVTWGTRKETVASTVMVLVMVFIAALFFLLVDGIVFNVIQWVLGF